MKIAILGPVTTDTYFGGVANFDEELNKGFHRLGYESVILTLQKNAENGREGIKFFSSAIALIRYLKKYSPDLVIASLQYGIFFAALPKTTRKIYVLHGFFNKSVYGRFKSTVAPLYQKAIASMADEVVANSYFTKMVNSDCFGIPCDRVIYCGISYDYLERVNRNSNIVQKKERGSILFAGRLVKAKRSMEVLMAMKLLQQNGFDCRLYIAGDGPESPILHQYAEKNNVKVHFLGALPHSKLFDYYARSEIFISLNDSEPMGITFFEAALLGCKIISPFTGGQVENLYDLPASCRQFVNADDPESIARGLAKMLTSHNITSYKFPLDLRYERVAVQFLNICC